MKKITLFLLVAFLSCNMPSTDRVEQRVYDEDLPLLCKSGTCFITIVWYDQEPVKIFYDDIESITDSIVTARQQQGQRILDALNKAK